MTFFKCVPSLVPTVFTPYTKININSKIHLNIKLKSYGCKKKYELCWDSARQVFHIFPRNKAMRETANIVASQSTIKKMNGPGSGGAGL